MTNTSEKKIRVTKANRFADIGYLLSGEPVKFGTTIEMAQEFIAHEIELLAKKNKPDSKKMTATQKENEQFRERIMEFLYAAPADCDGFTCTAISKAVPCLNDFTTQKITPLMHKLLEQGRVTTKQVKGRTLWSAVRGE